jgi:hypothetical protein
MSWLRKDIGAIGVFSFSTDGTANMLRSAQL